MAARMLVDLISESALVCQLPAPLSLRQQQRLWAFNQCVRDLPECLEAVVGMNNLTVFFRVGCDVGQFSALLAVLWDRTDAVDFQGRVHEIAVSYGGEFGEDLVSVAAFHGVDVQTVVRWHSEPLYTVFMIGFQPGFPYLGGLPECLHTPRRSTPRTVVPAGSVGIGGAQTGIYPFASPGGWQLIGSSDVCLFDAAASSPALLSAGDRVRFVVKEICQ